MPGAGFPVFDPAPWNSAYKVTFRNVPLNGTFGGSRVSWPYAPDSAVNTPQDCFSEGFDSASAENASVVSHTTATTDKQQAAGTPIALMMGCLHFNP
jgi:hypothetical protein